MSKVESSPLLVGPYDIGGVKVVVPDVVVVTVVGGVLAGRVLVLCVALLVSISCHNDGLIVTMMV